MSSNEHGITDDTETDTEGHRYVPSDERPSVGDTPEAQVADGDEPDDTEGHRLYARNVGANFDEDPTDTGQDDVTGQPGDTASRGDDPDNPEDTEGHRLYNRNVGADFDDTEGHAMKPRGIEAAGEEDGDIEGHGMKPRGIEAAGDEGDDIEGHVIRPKGVTPAGDEGDDTEGHRISRYHVGVEFG